jgi:methyl-accepting chemotaxis protein
MTLKLSIQGKLYALSLIGLAFVAIVGATGLVATQRLTVSSQQIAEGGAALRSQMEADQAHDALRSDVLAALLASQLTDTEERKAIKADLLAHGKLFTESIKALDEMPLEPATRAAVAKVQPALTAYLAATNAVVELAFTDRDAAAAKMPEFKIAFKRVETEMETLSDLLADRSKAVESASHADAALANKAIVGALVVSLVVLLLAGTVVSRSIVRPVRRAVEIAETVAAGDLSSQIVVQGHGETAQLLAALARMNDRLVDVVGTVRLSSDSIATGSSEISIGNQDLSQRTEEQASNLQRTAASMEQISATVQANAETTRRAEELADTATSAASKGGAAVNQMVATMAEIAGASEKINDIISVIDGIAFQTNILALNAAVEAARAGEQGRGFAVVASEVRTLAQRSATAAKEIKQLIQTSVEKVTLGSVQAADAGQTMEDVVARVRQVNQLIAEVSGATQEQTSGIGQVSDAVTQLDQVTQQNAALVEEAAAAAESLKAQTSKLVASVSVFQLP